MPYELFPVHFTLFLFRDFFALHLKVFTDEFLRRSICKMQYNNHTEDVSLLSFNAWKFIYFNAIVRINWVEVDGKIRHEQIPFTVHQVQRHSSVRVLKNSGGLWTSFYVCAHILRGTRQNDINRQKRRTWSTPENTPSLTRTKIEFPYTQRRLHSFEAKRKRSPI